ncbi:aldolase/citrate lyase family protein [soil metagenome]
MTSRLQDALATQKPLWGGWITAPSFAGPEDFARSGYDYIGFDTQHGYLDDADVAVMLRRLEHVPIATVVRLPSAQPAPIGRVLDAGADGVIIAMVETPEQAAAAVAATCYAPIGVRSFGPLRPSLGFDIDALQARASVFVMIETAQALAVVDDICAVPGLTGIYVGPADLAVSLGYPALGSHPEVDAAVDRIQQAAAAAGLVAGIHAGNGATGKRFSDRGFRLLTLLSESQALRHGATEVLRVASGIDGSTPNVKGYS